MSMKTSNFGMNGSSFASNNSSFGLNKSNFAPSSSNSSFGVKANVIKREGIPLSQKAALVAQSQLNSIPHIQPCPWPEPGFLPPNDMLPPFPFPHPRLELQPRCGIGMPLPFHVPEPHIHIHIPNPTTQFDIV